jgi:hypothetical protein
MAQILRTKDEQIVTQSQLKLALDFLQTRNSEFTFKELLATTNVLVDYVMNGYTKEIGETADKIDTHMKKKELIN